MKAEFEVSGQKVELDTSEMEERLGKKISVKMEKYFKDVEKWRETKERNGKGVVETFNPNKKQKLIEEFQKGERCNPQIIKEQWTIAVPKFARYELAGHLRDFVWVTDAVKGKPGETVNIPYVNDVDFAHVVPKTGTFTATTGLINVLTTTLHESGAYFDAYYGDIEKIDANLLDELNRVFAHAAIRAEDVDLISLINTATTGQFVSEGGGTDVVLPIEVGSSSYPMSADLIVDGLAGLMNRGKEIHPGECIVTMTPAIWAALVKDVIGSASLATSRPDVAVKGMLQDLLGVTLVVVGRHQRWHSEQELASSYNWAYLMRPKRALALAPKRDILIETDKLIATRQLRIAASHTYGVCAIDLTEVMPLRTGSGRTT